MLPCLFFFYQISVIQTTFQKHLGTILGLHLDFKVHLKNTSYTKEAK